MNYNKIILTITAVATGLFINSSFAIIRIKELINQTPMTLSIQLGQTGTEDYSYVLKPQEKQEIEGNILLDKTDKMAPMTFLVTDSNNNRQLANKIYVYGNKITFETPGQKWYPEYKFGSANDIKNKNYDVTIVLKGNNLSESVFELEEKK